MDLLKSLKKFIVGRKMNREINNIERYMDENYEGAILISTRRLNLKKFTQRDISNIENNCSLTSITRIINYYIDRDEKEIYDEVLKIARRHMFSEKLGTFPNKIDNISREFFRRNNIDLDVRGVYFGNFYSHIKNEIDNLRPLIMNLAIGYYGRHSLVVVGYRIYKYRGLNIKILEVIDGWRRDIRYIDYTAFMAKYIFPLCSYDLFKVKSRLL